MKYFILLAVIYGIYRVSSITKLNAAQKQNKLSQEEDEGFTDFEELD